MMNYVTLIVQTFQPRRGPRAVVAPRPGDFTTMEHSRSTAVFQQATVVCINATKQKLREFNRCHFPQHPSTRNNIPLFLSGIDASGTFRSAADSACTFFSNFKEYASSTLSGYKWQIEKIYEEFHAGLTPWDKSSTDPAARQTLTFIKQIIKNAPKPASKRPLDHELFKSLIDFLRATNPDDARGRPPVSQFAMAAMGCILRSTGCRASEALKLEASFITPNYVNGRRQGLNILYPEFDSKGKPFSFKGHNEPDARLKLIPETLSDGYPVTQVILDFLEFAPRSGPLFQKVDGGGRWRGTSWTVSDVTSKLRDALRKVNPHWGPYMEKLFSSHCFRTTAITAMATDGHSEGIIATAVNHRRGQVTTDSYTRPSAETIRAALASTGTRRKV
jgi:integrase